MFDSWYVVGSQLPLEEVCQRDSEKTGMMKGFPLDVLGKRSKLELVMEVEDLKVKVFWGWLMSLRLG